MTDITFINTQYIKTNTSMNINVDDKYLIPAIQTAQEKYIKGSLGSGLYNELRYQISAHTLTTLNRTLLETYIQPALCWYTIANSLPLLHFKVDAKGVGRMTSENENPVDRSDLIYLQETFMNDAETFNQQLINYLKQNQTSFPLYINPGSGLDTVHPKRDGYRSSGGIYFYDNCNTNDYDDD
jgi:hypothetical protein